MEFTLQQYKQLLHTLLINNYHFTTYRDYMQSFPDKEILQSLIILRHDVDLMPENSLKTACIEKEMGIRGTYYFRIVPECFDAAIIEKIADLGHEVGYHYEDIDLVIKSKNGKIKSKNLASGTGITIDELIDLAYESFCDNLQIFRSNFDIKTICMHGSPLSRYDNRIIWQKYDYHDLGIIGEPYLDVDFKQVLYLTDTGRKWDGMHVSVRDKVLGTKTDGNGNFLFWKFHHTKDIICAAQARTLPEQTMITIHPQRWHDHPLPWMKELVWQNVKNLAKYILIKSRKKRACFVFIT